MLRKFLALAFALLTFSPSIWAQQALNNESVIKLVNAGLSDDLIVTTVNAQSGTYNTTTDGVIALKNAGLSDKVVAAIIKKGSASSTQVPSAAPQNDPNDPNAEHEAGIYASGKSARLAMLEPSIYSQGKVGGVFTSAMTYGIAKAKVKAVIRNAHSNVRIDDPNTVFYFYFEKQGAGLSNASGFYAGLFGGTSTPNEYTLLRFDVKKDTRETTTGKFNAYGGSGGTDEKATIDFTYVRLRPGVYKVTPSKPLSPGEYGFVSPTGAIAPGPYTSGAAGSSRVFDFGVN